MTLALISIWGYVGCAVGATPAATPVVSGARTAEAATKGPWQEAWNAATTGARRESELFLYGLEPQTIDIGKKFGQEYGISVDTYIARAPELTEKMSREYSAHIFNVDVILIGWTTILQVMKPKDLVNPLDSTIILPEAVDPGKWVGGKFPWVDPEHYAVNFGGTINTAIWRNAELVKENEIKEYRDILKPQWKGKIVFNDPTIIGGGSVWFRLYYPVLGEDYMKALIKQEPVVIRDKRLFAEWLSHGKYVIGLCGDTQSLLALKEAGAPIEPVETREGQYVSTGAGSLTVASRPPHPDAARLFINWILTKEGQTMWSKSLLFPSFRVDVPSDHLNPFVVPKPGRTYLADTPETAAQMDRYIELSKNVLGPIIPK